MVDGRFKRKTLNSTSQYPGEIEGETFGRALFVLNLSVASILSLEIKPGLSLSFTFEIS
jgi:hypothetical protein